MIGKYLYQKEKEKLTGKKSSNHALMISAVSLSGGDGEFLHCCKASARVVAADSTFNADGCAF